MLLAASYLYGWPAHGRGAPELCSVEICGELFQEKVLCLSCKTIEPPYTLLYLEYPNIPTGECKLYIKKWI